MSRKIDPARACLHVRDWPASDQALWNEAVSDDDFESEAPRPNWRPHSVRAYRAGYGRWINHLMRAGAALTLSAAERATPDQVTLYLKELRSQGLAPQTIANRLSELLSVMLVFAPEQEWNWLRQRFNRQASIANEARKQRPLTVLSGDILVPALKNMNALRKRAPLSDIQKALAFRNWLMVGMLLLTSLRVGNTASVRIGVHLKLVNGEWIINIPAQLVKQKKGIKMPVPAILNPHIDFYLEHVRPILLRGVSSDRLWISQCGTAMNSHSIYLAVVNFTRKVFGEPINPHRFRHITATSVAIGAPEKTEEARAQLTHSDKRMTEDHYIVAQSLAASRDNADLIAQLRKRLRPAHGRT